MVSAFRGDVIRRMRAACVLAFLSRVRGGTLDNPMKLSGASVSSDAVENPGHVDPNLIPGDVYAELFDRALDAVDDYFPIAYANRYEGRIVAKPISAPGFERFWKAGSPDSSTGARHLPGIPLSLRVADPRGQSLGLLCRSRGPKGTKGLAGAWNQTILIPVFGDLGTIERDQFLVVDPEATSPSSMRPIAGFPRGGKRESNRKSCKFAALPVTSLLVIERSLVLPQAISTAVYSVIADSEPIDRRLSLDPFVPALAPRAAYRSASSG